MLGLIYLNPSIACLGSRVLYSRDGSTGLLLVTPVIVQVTSTELGG